METSPKELVDGARARDYGAPKKNFALIAALWSTYLGVEITPLDAALMMALLKIARCRTGRVTEDSLIDLGGYAEVAKQIWKA